MMNQGKTILCESRIVQAQLCDCRFAFISGPHMPIAEGQKILLFMVRESVCIYESRW